LILLSFSMCTFCPNKNTCYLLLVTCYLLLVTCYFLLVTCYLSQLYYWRWNAKKHIITMFTKKWDIVLFKGQKEKSLMRAERCAWGEYELSIKVDQIFLNDSFKYLSFGTRNHNFLYIYRGGLIFTMLRHSLYLIT